MTGWVYSAVHSMNTLYAVPAYLLGLLGGFLLRGARRSTAEPVFVPSNVLYLRVEKDKLYHAACTLTQQADTHYASLGGWAGEARRSYVYQKLIEQFPTVSQRRMSMAIEAALCYPK
jgi:hypothetical protein